MSTNEISKNLKCIVMRNGIEIWKEADRINDLSEKLIKGKVGFIMIDNEIINSADISGIFSPQTMEETTMRKNGYWKCKYGKWHERGKKCECRFEQLSGEDLAKYSQS